MKKSASILIVLFITVLNQTKCFAQVDFEDGYYIDNNNKRIECQIQNINWRINPEKVEFRLTKEAKKEIVTIDSIKEFGIYNLYKYIRKTVDADLSKISSGVDNLTTGKKPILRKKTLFLKVLIEGPASLYSFRNSKGEKYFFSTDNSSIVDQLIYRKYRTSDGQFATYDYYKQQLLNSLKCEQITYKEINKIRYDKNSLLKVFIKSNTCQNSEFENYSVKTKENSFDLNIRSGFNISTFTVKDDHYQQTGGDANFKANISLRLGIELEYLLQNKLSFVFGPVYQYYKSKTEIYAPFANSNIIDNNYAEINFQSIQLPIRVRNYFYVNDNSKTFINGSIIPNISFNSSVNYASGREAVINPNFYFGCGVGYKYNDKYILELRYQGSSDALYEEVATYSRHRTLSFVVGYTIL